MRRSDPIPKLRKAPVVRRHTPAIGWAAPETRRASDGAGRKIGSTGHEGEGGPVWRPTEARTRGHGRGNAMT